MPSVDPSTQQLLRACTHIHGSLLWLADEHHDIEVFQALSTRGQPTEVVTNRFDVYQSTMHSGLSARFSDWVFDSDRQYDTIALRVCKEKAVNQHLFGQCMAMLKEDGELILAGEKTSGIKSYCKDLQGRFQNAEKPKKQGIVYVARFRHPTRHQAPHDAETYSQMRPIGQVGQITLYSKPGQYGWNKIDQGSQLLVTHFRQYCENLPSGQLTNLLDLGCGYGFLTFATADLPFASRTATDNNAAAIQSCRHTAQTHHIAVDTSADHLGQSIQQKFDFILCNPPFHKGFDVHQDLTRQFLQAARSKLTERGRAFFVVNSFVGLEKRAQDLFDRIELLENDGQFKVFCLRR